VPQPRRDIDKRTEFLPIIARAFAELGYRRATTAELAARCEVQENILYRLWPDKKAMFIAAIEHVYEHSVAVWSRAVPEDDGKQDRAERLLAYEAEHHGEFGLYRIIFAGLNETDDPDVRAALRRMYDAFRGYFAGEIDAYRERHSVSTERLTAEQAAWAMIGMGTVTSIGRELGLINDRQRAALLADLGRIVMPGGA
jgi:AcrR family transcriptional regulator